MHLHFGSLLKNGLKHNELFQQPIVLALWSPRECLTPFTGNALAVSFVAPLRLPSQHFNHHSTQRVYKHLNVLFVNLALAALWLPSCLVFNSWIPVCTFQIFLFLFVVGFEVYGLTLKDRIVIQFRVGFIPL